MYLERMVINVRFLILDKNSEWRAKNAKYILSNNPCLAKYKIQIDEYDNGNDLFIDINDMNDLISIYNEIGYLEIILKKSPYNVISLD